MADRAFIMTSSPGRIRDEIVIRQAGDPQGTKASKRLGEPSSELTRARPVSHLPKALRTGTFNGIGDLGG